MPFKDRGRTRKLVLATAVAFTLAGTGAALAWPAGEPSPLPSSTASADSPSGQKDKQHRQDKQHKPGKQHATQKRQLQDRHKGRNSGECHQSGRHSDGGWKDGRWPGLPDGR